MMKNQIILATQQKRKTSKPAIDELFSEISNKKEISYEQLHHCEGNTFLEKFTKSINSQTNIKWSGNDSTSKIILSPCRKHLYLSGDKKKKKKISAYVFLEILQRYADFVFWVLWVCLAGHTQYDEINL